MNSMSRSVFAAALAGVALVAISPTDLAAAAQAGTNGDHDLTVRVVYPSNQSGHIWVGLYAGEAGFDAGEEMLSARIPATEDALVAVFEDLPPGEYGIISFHDSNGDGDFNRNFMGIPSEKYGFSNNPRPRFRAATWAEARFTINDEGASEMTIELQGAM